MRCVLVFARHFHDLVNSISKEDDIPMQHFALAKSMIEVLKEQTSDIIQKAEVISGKNKNIKDLPNDIARLQELGKSNIGSIFICMYIQVYSLYQDICV